MLRRADVRESPGERKLGAQKERLRCKCAKRARARVKRLQREAACSRRSACHQRRRRALPESLLRRRVRVRSPALGARGLLRDHAACGAHRPANARVQAGRAFSAPGTGSALVSGAALYPCAKTGWFSLVAAMSPGAPRGDSQAPMSPSAFAAVKAAAAWASAVEPEEAVISVPPCPSLVTT